MMTALVILTAITVVLFFAVIGLSYTTVFLYRESKPIDPPPLWEDADYEQQSIDW